MEPARRQVPIAEEALPLTTAAVVGTMPQVNHVMLEVWRSSLAEAAIMQPLLVEAGGGIKVNSGLPLQH